VHEPGVPPQCVIRAPHTVAASLHAVATAGLAVGGTITSGQPGRPGGHRVAFFGHCVAVTGTVVTNVGHGGHFVSTRGVTVTGWGAIGHAAETGHRVGISGQCVILGGPTVSIGRHFGQYVACDGHVVWAFGHCVGVGGQTVRCTGHCVHFCGHFVADGVIVGIT